MVVTTRQKAQTGGAKEQRLHGLFYSESIACQEKLD